MCVRVSRLRVWRGPSGAHLLGRAPPLSPQPSCPAALLSSTFPFCLEKTHEARSQGAGRRPLAAVPAWPAATQPTHARSRGPCWTTGSEGASRRGWEQGAAAGRAPEPLRAGALLRAPRPRRPLAADLGALCWCFFLLASKVRFNFLSNSIVVINIDFGDACVG